MIRKAKPGTVVWHVDGYRPPSKFTIDRIEDGRGVMLLSKDGQHISTVPICHLFKTAKAGKNYHRNKKI